MAQVDKTQQQQKSNEEQETVVVDDEELRTREEAQRQQASGDEDSREGHSEDTHEEEGAHGDESDAERDHRREQNRLKRARKKETQDRAWRELRFLRERNAQLERRQSETEARVAQNEGSTVDSRLAEIDERLEQAYTVISSATITAAKSDDAAVVARANADLREATKIKDQLIEAKRYMSATKDSQGRRPAAAPLPRPEVKAAASDWASSHRWYNPALTDPASQAAERISRVLDAEGWDGGTEEYWEEMDNRLSRHPATRDLYETRQSKRQTDDDDGFEEEPQRVNGSRRVNGTSHTTNGGPKLSAGGKERPLKKGEFYISADRKDALMKMGVWEDPVLRARYIKQYQKYDQEQRARA